MKKYLVHKMSNQNVKLEAAEARAAVAEANMRKAAQFGQELLYKLELLRDQYKRSMEENCELKNENEEMKEKLSQKTNITDSDTSNTTVTADKTNGDGGAKKNETVGVEMNDSLMWNNQAIHKVVPIKNQIQKDDERVLTQFDFPGMNDEQDRMGKIQLKASKIPRIPNFRDTILDEYQ